MERTFRNHVVQQMVKGLVGLAVVLHVAVLAPHCKLSGKAN